MQAGAVVIINDVIGAVQTVLGGDYYEILCDDGKIRKIRGKATVVSGPHATALLFYTKLLERMHK